MQPQNPFQAQQNQQPQPNPGAAGPYPPAQQPYPAGQTTQAPNQNYSAPDMQPVDNVNQYPVDYLNQIATPLPVKKASPLMIFGLIGSVLIASGLMVFMLIKSTAPPDVGTQLYALQARLETLSTVTSATGQRLTQDKLSNINSTLGTTIKSMQANLKSYMDSKGIKDAKNAAAAKKTESTYTDKLTQSLDDAYLTGTLDRNYSSEITYQLTILKSKMQKLKATANSKSFNEFYNKNITSIDTVSEQLSKFQNTK